MVKCRICDADPSKDPHCALKRVNEKGVAGIWECYKHTEGINPTLIELLSGDYDEPKRTIH